MILTSVLAITMALPSDRPETAQLLQLVNAYRSAHGVSALSLDQPLCKVAEGHASFMFQNKVLTHVQQNGMKGFVGNNLAARAATIGWSDELSELVGFANTGLADAVQAIFDSPCHRVRFLKPGELSLGAGAQGDFVCLLVGGEPTAQTIVSPPQGATNVPTSWFGSRNLSGTKTGAGGTRYGYPIVFLDSRKSQKPFVTENAELLSTDNHSVQVKVLDPSNDDRFAQAVAMVPLHELAPGQEYSATVTIKYSDGSKSQRQWSFRTKG